MEIKFTREIERHEGSEDQVVFVVQIGPDDHVCTEVKKYYVGLDEDETFHMAQAYVDGAYAALTAASGLASRFIAPNDPVKLKSVKGE